MADKIKLSHRKFYNKWVYKVSLRLSGISVIRSMGIEETKKYCLAANPEKQSYSTYQKCWDNKDKIIPMLEFLEQWDTKLYFKRIESNILDLYTNDRKFYDSVYQQFSPLVIYRAEPKNLGIDENTDADTVVVKKYPHNRYRHKVYLLPHKMRDDKEGKRRFVDWMKSQTPRITCSAAVEDWFIKTNWNWDRRYVLVEDENTLLMLKLRCSDAVGRVYNYKICDK